MPRCDVCQGSLRLTDILRCLLKREDVTYPMRGIDDLRHEEVVDWICSRCRRRAVQRRAEMGTQDAEGASQGAAGRTSAERVNGTKEEPELKGSVSGRGAAGP